MKKNLLSNICLSLFLMLTFSLSYAQDKAPVEQKKDDIGNLRREGIDVVQNRVFIKGHRSEFTLGTGYIFDDPYLRYELAEFRYTYHFREEFGFETSYSYALHQDKPILNDLANIPCDVPPSLFDKNGKAIPNCGVTLNPGPDPYKHIMLGNFVWSPIYGKFSVFSKKILHFDIFATAGGGYYIGEKFNHFGFNVGVGSKVFVNDWMAVRFDFRNFTIKESAPFNHIANNRTLSVGMSFFVPTKVEHEQ